MDYKVELVNRELGRNCLFGQVQGLSGKTYATSRCRADGTHVAELTPQEYEAAIEDISRGWHRPLCRWVPRFVRMQEAVVEKTKGTKGNKTRGEDKR